MKKLLLVLSSLFVFSIFITGCGPSYVVTKPAPPAYTRPMAPGHDFVWVEGEWVLNHGRYVYKPGYWTHWKRRYHHYVPGHWEQKHRGYYWKHGYWTY